MRIFVLLAAAAAAYAAGPDQKEWIQLFNGKDLTGWAPKIRGHELNDNFGNTFRVENGLLKVAYDGYDRFNERFGHIFYNRKFSHYIIAVEYRFVGEQATAGPAWALRNSGIMVHCQDPATMGRDQDFPISIEVQLLGGSGSGTRTTANLCTPGTHVVRNGALFTTHCVNSTSKTYHGEQWVRVEVEVRGSERIRHIVEGETVLSYEKPQIGGAVVSGFDPAAKRDGTLLEEGYISLQSESHPIEFRKVELLNLVGCMDPKASNYKSYYVKADNSQCRFGSAGWPRFRGPDGSGVADAGALPREIAPDKNVNWKVSVPYGKSSPVIAAGRIFLTGHEQGKLLTFALDRGTGKELWRREAPGNVEEKRHKLNDAAAPSPVTDGTNVYVFFAGYGLLSYTADGAERWRLPMGPFTNFHGMGASPVLADGKVLMICDQDQDAHLLAVDQKTGKPVWKTPRPEMVHSFSTPLVHGGELIVPGSYQMTSYDIATGKLVWKVRGLTYQVKSVPVVVGDTLYFNGWAPGGEPSERIELPEFPAMLKDYDADRDGRLSKTEVPKNWLPGNWDMQDLDKDGLLNAKDWQYYSMRRTSTNSAMAIRLGGRGDVTDTHVKWQYQKSLPDVPAVLVYRGVLYLIRNGGILQTLDPGTGKMLKQGRLPHALDEYYASPVAGDGKVYLISRNGNASVLEAGADWGIVATGDFGEEVFATPAIADGHILVRTATALYDFAGAGGESRQ
ncbi:MAG: family 16 glycoside hydrolase [Bryobacteraceae bacterium]|nr:family 16 glycoside hydrolase [Bryobacteraceae bacterium]